MEVALELPLYEIEQAYTQPNAHAEGALLRVKMSRQGTRVWAEAVA
jgi:hypothetical protein